MSYFRKPLGFAAEEHGGETPPIIPPANPAPMPELYVPPTTPSAPSNLMTPSQAKTFLGINVRILGMLALGGVAIWWLDRRDRRK